MLQYYLRMEPHLFRTAVDTELAKLRDEKRERAAKEQQLAASSDSTELALYKRMEEVRSREVRSTLEDLMYVSILEKFLLLGVDMLPRMDGFVDPPNTNLKALTEGIHSREALELVREHLLQIMGPTASAYSTAYVKMSKFQMAQVYAASVMFGYFLRRVDERFQLEKAAGTLPLSKEDAVARLERLFAAAESVEDSDNPDYAEGDATTVDLDSPAPAAPSLSSLDDDPTTWGLRDSARRASGAGASSSGASAAAGASGGSSPLQGGGGGGGGKPAKAKSALRRYVESFDQNTMVETARIVSVEGAALVERQTSALLGDIKKLTAQMQEAVGDDADSMQEAMSRMARAVEKDLVETVTMQVQTQRRSVLEAVAFGTFLRDVEGWVQGDYQLLTPLPAPKLPPQQGFAA
ncbi:hypothetical protein HXX76_000552 [Chlamydomonas incerta]|uniref:Uncharacterized protein n=1 Tax=Chlamydomonas incerta TaxID=51695 RepID=A0A835WEB6_CHLIN|nr:hypothetical protein HXX76_000552 [Chlamydomonas incerta]|eukprot:KAG2445949.1 hypothetical protein HXX76_000552 [Chlamydomonas incerta]